MEKNEEISVEEATSTTKAIRKAAEKEFSDEVKNLAHLFSQIQYLTSKVYSLEKGTYFEFPDGKRLGPQQIITMKKFFKQKLLDLVDLCKSIRKRKKAVNEKLNVYNENLVKFFNEANLGNVYDNEVNCRPIGELKKSLPLLLKNGIGYYRSTISKLFSIYNRVNKTQIEKPKKPYRITDLEWKYLGDVLKSMGKSKTGNNELSITDISTLISRLKIPVDQLTEQQENLLSEENTINEANQESDLIAVTLDCLKKEQEKNTPKKSKKKAKAEESSEIAEESSEIAL